MTRFRIRLLTAAACVIAGAGCTLSGCTYGGQSDAGRPSAIFPPRPVVIAADRIPPCSMLSPDQARALNLEKPRPPSVAVVDGRPSPSCTWFGAQDQFDVSTQFIPIDARGAAAVPGSTVIVVNGFGAVRNIPVDAPGPPLCQVAVDVAPDQTIRVQIGTFPDSTISNDELCRQATDVTAMVMTTIVMMTPR